MYRLRAAHGLPMRNRKPMRTRRSSASPAPKARPKKATKRLEKPRSRPVTHRFFQAKSTTNTVPLSLTGACGAAAVSGPECAASSKRCGRRMPTVVPDARQISPCCMRSGIRTPGFSLSLRLFFHHVPGTTFVVPCKKCRRDVPTGVAEFPFKSIVVDCPLCGEKRRYLPSEIFLGRVDQLVNHQKRTRAI